MKFDNLFRNWVMNCKKILYGAAVPGVMCIWNSYHDFFYKYLIKWHFVIVQYIMELPMTSHIQNGVLMSIQTIVFNHCVEI